MIVLEFMYFPLLSYNMSQFCVLPLVLPQTGVRWSVQHLTCVKSHLHIGSGIEPQDTSDGDNVAMVISLHLGQESFHRLVWTDQTERKH